MATVEDLKALIGTRGKPTTFLIDSSMVRLYNDTIDERGAKWQDRMPPGLLAAAMFMGEGVPMEWPYPGIVDGGLEQEYLKPIKVGDVITITNEVYNVEDKSSDKGKRLLISMKSTITNQKGELVAASLGRVMNIG